MSTDSSTTTILSLHHLPPLASILTLRHLFALGGAWLAFEVLRALYNVSPLHPLYRIPGPRLAAATYLPEIYYDLILGGRYTHAIGDMHKKYGPIVRINPSETHCNDASFSDEIYAVGGRKRDKPTHQINGSGVGNTNGFGTKDHDKHRTRRAPVARFFSQNMISHLESDVHRLIHLLCDKLLQESGRREPINVADAYSCFTSDTISKYCFGESFGLLDQDTWTPNFREATLAILKPVFYFRFLPFLAKSQVLAVPLLDYLPKDVALLLRTMKITIPNHVFKAQRDLRDGVHYERPTVFGELLQSELVGDEKKPERLADEAIAVVGAGTETTSWALAVITYHLLDKPQILSRLTAELSGAVSDPTNLPGWITLAELPYLSAVIQEGLRLSYGVSGRTARTPTGEDLFYKGEFEKKPVELVLPRGYAVGMSAYLAHHDESLFPDSHSFIPERWLDGEGKRRDKGKGEMDRGLLSFSKGSRACLGKNLALCELHLSLAALTLRVIPRMRLTDDTTIKDVTYDHDMFIPVTAPGTRGVRVTIE